MFLLVVEGNGTFPAVPAMEGRQSEVLVRSLRTCLSLAPEAPGPKREP